MENKQIEEIWNGVEFEPVSYTHLVNNLDTEMWEDGKKYYYSLREHYNDKLMKAEYDVELRCV